MPSKSTIAQYYNDNKNNCRTMPRAGVSLERLRSSSVGGAFVARWRLGRPLIAAAQLVAKAWALSHFLRSFWSKSPGQPTSLYSSVNSGKRALISFLPPSESQAPWRDFEKPSSRATSRRRAPPRPPPTTPPGLGELLSPPLCLCLQDPPKKHKNPRAVSCSDSDGINIA